MTLPQNSAEPRLGELPCQVVQQNPSRQHFRKNQCFNVFHIFPCFSCKCSRSVSRLQPNLRKTPRKTKASPRRMVFKVSASGCGSSTAFVVASAITGSGTGARGFVVASLRRGAGAAARSGVLTGCRGAGAGAGAGGSAFRFQVRTWPGVVESRGKSPGKVSLETTAKIWPGSPGGHENPLLDLASWIKNQDCAPFCFPQKKRIFIK